MLCAAAAATALAAAAGAQSAPGAGLKSPRVEAVGRANGTIVDGTVRSQNTSALAPSGYWGGEYKISSGETVTVYASNSYPVDAALGQRWANFLGSLIHGSELSKVTVLLTTPQQISTICGSDALACYSARGSALYAPGEDPSAGISAEAVVTHEYGHHVAANRVNPPWNALDWGPKRWASAMQVCARTKRGELYPGAEDPVRYEQNPGEAWAETYRLLNERRLGLPETPWEVVSQSLYPSTAALAAAEQDVRSPWTPSTASVRTGKVSRTAKSRTYTFSTPLDGALEVSLRTSSGLRVALNVYAATARVAHATGVRTVTRSTTVCGTRTYRVRVTDTRGAGSFRLAVTAR
jgi:hypothetical protein